MIFLLKNICFSFFIILFFSSCLVDVVEDVKVKTLNVRSLETIVQYIDFSKYDSIPQYDFFPILGWEGISNKHLTIERVREVKNAGLTLSLSGFTNVDSVQKALNLAQALGIKIFIWCPELKTQTEKTVIRFKDHPANAGYFLQDEPSTTYSPSLKKLVEKIESFDNTRFCYINLLPNYHSNKDYVAENYEEYIKHFVENIPLKILSFDFYPIVNNYYLRPSWYNNLEIIKNESEKEGIPFWAFALTSSHWEYPIPTLEHLRLQVYSNLAYGAKGIQYFTFWIPDKDYYTSAPIDKNGNKTNVYYLLQQMNKEIHRFAYIFQTSNVNRVSHYGDIPEGTTQFSNAPYFMRSIDIRGGNALLSEMENDDNSFFMIQNTNLNKEIGITIQLDEQTQIILKNGSIIPASLIKEEFKLTPGDMVMFMR